LSNSPQSISISYFADTTVVIARIAKETGLSRQTVYRIKDDPAGAESALAGGGCNRASLLEARSEGGLEGGD
jgi:Helix-turn-helix domain of resolvase